MSKITGRAAAGSAAGYVALAALAALFALAQPREARAQWTTSGSTTHTTNHVGIGTAAPASKLDVTFDGNATTGVRIFDTRSAGAEFGGHLLFYGYSNVAGAPARFGQIGGLKENGTQGSMLGFLGFYTNDGSASYSAVERMRISSGGNVGIGTNAPTARLMVNGAGGFGGVGAAEFRLFNSVYGGAFAQHLDNSGNWQLYDTTTSATKLLIQPGGNGPINFYTGTGNFVVNGTGNVGIGTTAPGAKLDVNGAIRTSGPFGFSIGNDINHQRIEIQQSGANFYFLTAANTAAPVNVGGLAVTNSFPATPPTNGLYVQGNVGIGTATPGAKLDVNGAANVTGNMNVTGTITGGNIQAKYQDVAEWVPSTQKLAAGTVVVLDPERPNHVLASAASYDTAVAGVVSAQPGIILGEAGEGRVMVATTGRVRVRVDATRGPIRIGDLLVTSDVAGVAMRSEPVVVGGRKLHAPGTIIGKALEPLAGGTGEILVLLSMQ